MSDEVPGGSETEVDTFGRNSARMGLVIALAAAAAVGSAVLIQQMLEKRLSKTEVARLRFLRYLRERGHLES